MQEAQDCDCRIRQKDNKVIAVNKGDEWGKNKKVEQMKKYILQCTLLESQKNIILHSRGGGPWWQNKLAQVLLFSHYEIEGGMRRE